MSSAPLMGSTSNTVRRSPIGSTSVLVVVSDPAHRRAIVQECLAAGASVVGVGSIADVEHWPVGQIVIVDAAHLTPLWLSVGAREVVLLASSVEEGNAAMCNGATRSLHTPTQRLAVTALVAHLPPECVPLATRPPGDAV
jgi:hypothetical protein